jgi:hypothetical protein
MSGKPWPREVLEMVFWPRVARGEPDECWLWTGPTDKKDGYGIAHGLGQQKAHRLAYALGKEIPPKDVWVLHSCDVRLCCNPAHLFLGDRVDNMDDMLAKKRHSWGERNRHAKLNRYQVLGIRAKAAGGATYAQLAREYGVTPSLISMIVRELIWKTTSMPLK